MGKGSKVRLADGETLRQGGARIDAAGPDARPRLPAMATGGMDSHWRRHFAALLSTVESRGEGWRDILADGGPAQADAPVIGITGPPGAGKSTLIDGIAFAWAERGLRVGILAIDPSSPFSGGAVLGDRVRMSRVADHARVLIRSISARGHGAALNETAFEICMLMKSAGFDRVLLETVGAGQGDVAIAFLADCTVLVSVPGLGDAIQASKAGTMEVADIHVVNKADLPGASRLKSELADMLALAFPGRPGANARGEAGPKPAAAGDFRKVLARRFGDAADPEGSWHPPVLLADAGDAASAAEVAAAIDDFVGWLARGQLAGRRRDQIEAFMRGRLRSLLFDAKLREARALGSPFEDWVEKAAAGQIDVHAAVDRIQSLGRGGD
jgi:LAO/AO transport system kinase